jgi:hypothetical protein
MQTAYDNDVKLFESVTVTDLQEKKPRKITNQVRQISASSASPKPQINLITLPPVV